MNHMGLRVLITAPVSGSPVGCLCSDAINLFFLFMASWDPRINLITNSLVCPCRGARERVQDLSHSPFEIYWRQISLPSAPWGGGGSPSVPPVSRCPKFHLCAAAGQPHGCALYFRSPLTSDVPPPSVPVTPPTLACMSSICLSPPSSEDHETPPQPVVPSTPTYLLPVRSDRCPKFSVRLGGGGVCG